MARYEIVLRGCDDQTKVYLDLTPEEVALLDRLSKATKEESTLSCMPILDVYPEED